MGRRSCNTSSSIRLRLSGINFLLIIFNRHTAVKVDDVPEAGSTTLSYIVVV